jgi:hypothetical protein
LLIVIQFEHRVFFQLQFFELFFHEYVFEMNKKPPVNDHLGPGGMHGVIILGWQGSPQVGTGIVGAGLPPRSLPAPITCTVLFLRFSFFTCFFMAF